MTNEEQERAPESSLDSAFCIPHSEFPPWGFRDLLMLVLVAVLALFLVQGGAVLALFLVHGRAGLPPVARLMRDVRFLLPVQLIAYAVVVWIIYLLIAVKYQRQFWEALRWRTVGRNWPVFVFLGGVLALVSQLFPLLFPSHRHMPIEDLFTGPLAGYLLAFFGIAIAPFVEELFFRGMVYPVFERAWGLEPAVLATGACFAAIHVPQLGGGWPQVLAIFVVGAALSYARGQIGRAHV